MEEKVRFFVLWSSFLKKNSYFKLKLCLLLHKFESCHPSNRRVLRRKLITTSFFNRIVPSEEEQSTILVFMNPADLERDKVAV
jgi:hypothetical protein